MSRLKQLIQEIHRRSLWQVLGIYVAVSWVVFQVVQTLTEGLGLPDWVPPVAFVLLLIGLPIVMATALPAVPGAAGEVLRELASSLQRDCWNRIFLRHSKSTHLLCEEGSCPVLNRVGPSKQMNDVLDRLKAALAVRYVLERELGAGGMLQFGGAVHG